LAELPLKDFIHGTQIIADIPFGETTVFLTMAFALNDGRQMVKFTFWGLIIGAAIFLIVTIRNTVVLGNTEALLLSPSFEVIRLINIGFLSRTDILFAFGFTIGMFIKCSVLFYGAVLLLAQLLKLRTYQCLIFPLSCLTAILAIVIFSSATEQIFSGQNEALMLAIPFFHLFPPLTLSIAKIRNLSQKGYQP
jgi:spore germination protein KB